MEREFLRKIQLVQLEILKEVDRVCKENNICYFLDSGTLIGAVRHKGIIPWDDDIDIGMLRKEYDRFCEIAPHVLEKKYTLQTWNNDKHYPNPFAKVRMKNTLYIEEKGTTGNEKGFYIDIFPFDFVPNDRTEFTKIVNKTMDIKRMLLMKCGVKPWYERGKINWKKRVGYVFYQIRAFFRTHESLVQEYERIIYCCSETDFVYEQIGKGSMITFNYLWLNAVTYAEFESGIYPIPIGWHERLIEEYGDYMKLPPENQRENRHQILEVDFGEYKL